MKELERNREVVKQEPVVRHRSLDQALHYIEGKNNGEYSYVKCVDAKTGVAIYLPKWN
jgi:hypothetical protein